MKLAMLFRCAALAAFSLAPTLAQSQSIFAGALPAPSGSITSSDKAVVVQNQGVAGLVLVQAPISQFLTLTSALISAALPSASVSQLYGGIGGAGGAQAITLGTNLSLSGTTLNATGLQPGGSVSTNTVTPYGGSTSFPIANLAAQITSLVGNGLGVNPGSLALLTSGTGYAVGDVVTLTCSGCTIGTAPRIAVMAVSGGAITGSAVISSGLVTQAPAVNPLAFTQVSTTGGGSGASWTATLGPIAAAVSSPDLSTGGGPYNGLLVSGSGTAQRGLASNETIILGNYAAACLGIGGDSVYIGHNAFGEGNSACTQTVQGNYNTITGGDSARNIGMNGGAANGITLYGWNTARNLTGGAYNDLILGAGVGSTTFASGINVILIGTSSSVDTPSAGTNNYLNIGNILTSTGTGTPLTSQSLFAGALAATAPVDGGVVLQGCRNTACTSYLEFKTEVAAGTAQLDYWTGSAFGALTTPGSFAVGGGLTVGGASVLPSLSATSASLGGSALTAGTCSTASVTVAGATTTMVADASPQTDPGDDYYIKARVTAASTVAVKVCAVLAGTPTASLYNVRVIQ